MIVFRSANKVIFQHHCNINHESFFILLLVCSITYWKQLIYYLNVILSSYSIRIRLSPTPDVMLQSKLSIRRFWESRREIHFHVCSTWWAKRKKSFQTQHRRQQAILKVRPSNSNTMNLPLWRGFAGNSISNVLSEHCCQKQGTIFILPAKTSLSVNLAYFLFFIQ